MQLSTLITRETVEANVSVPGWEQAVDAVGTLLLHAKKILPDYIDAMKRVLKEIGPYAVIAPGIVLLHARPEDGVLEPCMGIITLSTPVRFGHSENDPVDLVFAFGAVDMHAHITALQQLAGLLGESQVLQKIRSAKNSVDLANVFAGKS